MLNQKKTLFIVVTAVIAIALIAIVAVYMSGVFTGGNNSPSNPTPSPTLTATSTAPIENPTASPTSSSTNPTQSPTSSPTTQPTPTPLPAASLTVAVTGTNYNQTMGQYTEFDCTVTINNAAYNSLLNKFVNAQNITVTSGTTGNPVTGDLTTTLLASLPQLQMNYGFSSNVGVSTVQGDHFTLTFYSDSPTVLPGGINTSTLADALTSHLNQMLATQV